MGAGCRSGKTSRTQEASNASAARTDCIIAAGTDPVSAYAAGQFTNGHIHAYFDCSSYRSKRGRDRDIDLGGAAWKGRGGRIEGRTGAKRQSGEPPEQLAGPVYRASESAHRVAVHGHRARGDH